MCIPLSSTLDERGILFLPMKTQKKYLSVFLVISSFLVAQSVFAQNTNAPAETGEPVMCTMDVMECPDGSYVGRTGPQCEFICPAGIPPQEELPSMSDPLPPSNPSGDNPDGEAGSTGPATVEPTPGTPRQDLRSERRGALSEVRQQRIINLAANISNRMDAAVNRLFNIISRIESRIQKLSLNGVDTSAAQDSLQEASRTLAEARALLRDIDTLVYEATTNEGAYGKWEDLRTRYQTIASLIRGTQTSLRETIANLKEAPIQTEIAPENQSAVSTPDSSTTTLPTL